MEALDPVASLQEQQQWSLGWLSPRISFSRDLPAITMLDRASPEKRKREQHELYCTSDSEFEFALSNPTLAMAEEDGVMLSADELFVDGKLRPFPLPPPPPAPPLEFLAENPLQERCWSMARHLSFENSRCESLSIEYSRGRAPRDCISLGSSRCSSPSRSVSLPATTLASTKASSAKHSSSRLKDFFKLRKLHVPSAKDVPVDLGEEHAVSSPSTSGRKLPISAKSFWPFSRSNSAGESKTSVPPPLPRRSNSAGESKTSNNSFSSHSKTNGATEAKASNATNSATNSVLVFANQGKRRFSSLASSDGRKNSLTCSGASLVALPCRRPDAVTLSSETTVPCSYITPPSMQSSKLSSTLSAPFEITSVQKDGSLLTQAGVPEHSANIALTAVNESDLASDLNSAARDAKRCSDASTSGLSTARPRAYGGPRKVQRNGLSSPVRNFARRSPGRRGGWNSPGRGSAGRIVLKNLERCSAGPKSVSRSRDSSSREGRKGSSERPSSYPVSVRVTPVINVPLYIGSLRGGSSSKPKLFNFRSLFSRKEKPLNATAPMPAQAMPTRNSNNWRNGG